jgi:pimeloyl-ACP methyl ester carboxylesterase
MRSATLPVPGATLYYEVRGTGPLLLSIPGGGGDAGVFDEMAAILEMDEKRTPPSDRPDLPRRIAELRARLAANTALFRSRMTAEGFEILPGEHPIAPVMIGDAERAGQMAEALLDHGVYAIGFSFPVVPHGQARIRVQLSAAHSAEDVERAVTAFVAARESMR